MTRIIYNKLVRDRIPEVIMDSGKECSWNIIAEADLEAALVRKLEEELQEFKENPCVEEAADLLEVIEGLCHFYGWPASEVLRAKAEKKAERGGFEKGIMLEYTE